MYPTLPSITSLKDVEAIEQIPLAERNLAKNTYAIFKHHAAFHPHKIGLRFLFTGSVEEPSLDYCYADLFARITQAANGFKNLGVGKEGVISILLPNLPQNHFALWGASAVGIANPINPLLKSAHIISIMNATKASVLVTLAPFPNNALWEKAEDIARQVPTLTTILTVNLAQFFSVEKRPTLPTLPSQIGQCIIKDFDTWLLEQSTTPLSDEKNEEDIACYFHTGGTTGEPKIAMHTHGNQVFSAWMVGQQLGWDATDVMHCGLPLFHVNAPLISGLAPFTVGGEVIMTSPQGFRSPTVLDHFWKVVEKYRISFFMAVPAVYAELNKRWKGEADVRSIKFAACGAAPMPTSLMKEFQERTHISLLEGYGLTEGTVFSSVNPPFGVSRIGSIGIRIPYQAMKAVLLDQQGKYVRDCLPNETGTIVIKGPNVFKGYLKSEENNHLWIKGWLNTGDLGQQDEAGYFKLAGRSKDLIIRGGHNIDPQMIEEALSQHPAVAMVAAVQKPDVRLGELPVAYVTLREEASASEAELLTFAAMNMTEKAAVPVNIYIVDAIPLTAVGKIYKPELRMDAIKRTFEERLEKVKAEGVEFDITIHPDKKHGQIAIVKLAKGVATEMLHHIQSLLKGFAVESEVQVACDQQF